MLQRPLIALSLLFAASCATPQDAPTDEIWTWRCDNGVTFTSQNTTSGVEIVAGGQTYQLPNVIAGSGVRSYNGRVEFWEHSGEAMLNGAAGGPYENCKH